MLILQLTTSSFLLFFDPPFSFFDFLFETAISACWSAVDDDDDD